MKQRTEEVCKAICQTDATLTKGREEMHQLQHKLDEQNVQLQGKELKAQKESLAECVESEQGGIASIQNEAVPEEDSPDQEQFSAFRKHLGWGSSASTTYSLLSLRRLIIPTHRLSTWCTWQ